MANDGGPPRGLHSWAVACDGEPRKGAPAVDVLVWIPRDVAREGIGAIAGYLGKHLGWSVHRNGGWCGGGLMPGPDELTVVAVKVRSREIKGALEGRPAPLVQGDPDYMPYGDPGWRRAWHAYTHPDERNLAMYDADQELRRIERRHRAAVRAARRA